MPTVLYSFVLEVFATTYPWYFTGQ